MSAEKLTIKISPEMNDTLKSLSAKKGTSVSALTRNLINIGLEKELAKESIDFVREQINEEIKASCFPQFERIAKLTAKIGYQSCSNFYLLAYIMDQVLPLSKKQDFDEIVKKSKMMAIAYLKLGEKEFADFAQSEDKAVDILNLK